MSRLSSVLKKVAKEDGEGPSDGGTTSASIPAFVQGPVNMNPTKKQRKKVSLIDALRQIEKEEEQWLK